MAIYVCPLPWQCCEPPFLEKCSFLEKDEPWGVRKQTSNPGNAKTPFTVTVRVTVSANGNLSFIPLTYNLICNVTLGAEKVTRPLTNENTIVVAFKLWRLSEIKRSIWSTDGTPYSSLGTPYSLILSPPLWNLNLPTLLFSFFHATRN